MREERNNIQGFWLGYVDVMALMFTLFLILFIHKNIENEKLRQENAGKKIKEFKIAWDNLRTQLKQKKIEIEKDMDFGGYKINLSEDNLKFAVDKFTLSNKQITELKEIVEIITSSTNNISVKNSIRISIGGHTDYTGSEEGNITLSYKRAMAVYRVFKHKLHKSIFLDVIGYGSKYPKIKNTKPEERKYWSQNRRVTITIQPIAVEYLQ